MTATTSTVTKGFPFLPNAQTGLSKSESFLWRSTPHSPWLGLVCPWPAEVAVFCNYLFSLQYLSSSKGIIHNFCGMVKPHIFNSKGSIKKTRPGCFCAKDCLDSEEMYIHGGILSLLLVVMGCSGLHCAILGCAGLYWAVLVSIWLH